MKGRAFAAVVLSALLLLSGLGIGGWWLLWQRGPLELAHHPLTMPRAARFVPASSAFSLYLYSDGQRPVAYARAVAPARRRRQAGEAVARLRDGAFAAAGLDYPGELAGWLGGELALALFDDPVASGAGESADLPPRGWLLALSSRDDDGARRFLQRFWQTRSLAGTDLQVSSYRGMGLISGRGALLGSRPEPLATALVDDDLVLIASGRNLLERALDVSQIPSLNQAGQPRLREGLSEFGSGAALAVASPAALHAWLGLPDPDPLPAAAPGSGLPSPRPAPTQPAAAAGAGSRLRPAPAIAAEVAAPSASAAGAEPQEDGPLPSPGRPAPAAEPAAAAAPAADAEAPTAANAAAPGPQSAPAALGAAPSPVLPSPRPAAAPAPAVVPTGPALLAVLQPRGPSLELRARLALPGVPRLMPLSPQLAGQLLDALGGSPTSLALIQDPAVLGGQPLLRPLLARSLERRSAEADGRQGPLPGLLAAAVHGPLLFSSAEDGWQLGTRFGDPPAGELDPLLQRTGLVEAPLEVEGHSLRVWTRLSLPGRGGRRERSTAAGDRLQAPLAGWREQRGELAWWGQSLASLEPTTGAGRSPTARRRALEELNVPTAPWQWSLDGEGARALLRAWQPWRLLSALAGGGLDGAVDGLALAVDGRPEPSALELRARLTLGR